MPPQRRLNGGGRSLERTALPRIFPANREIYREIARSAPTSHTQLLRKPHNPLRLRATTDQREQNKTGNNFKVSGNRISLIRDLSTQSLGDSFSRCQIARARQSDMATVHGHRRMPARTPLMFAKYALTGSLGGEPAVGKEGRATPASLRYPAPTSGKTRSCEGCLEMLVIHP